MKIPTLIFLVCLCCLITRAQVPTDLDGLYKFIQPVRLPACDAYGKQIEPADTQDINSDFEFYIERITNNSNHDIVISFVRWNEPEGTNLTGIAKQTQDELKDLNQRLRKSSTSIVKKYFLISAFEFQQSCQKIEGKVKFSVGTATTLIKYRPGSSKKSGDIGNDINIGLLVGPRIAQGKNAAHYFLFGANFGSVTLTPKTTNSAVQSETNVAAITPTVGYVFQYDKVQIGLFSGVDILSGEAYRQWIYRGRPWIGLGIGFSIFQSKSTSGTETQSAAH